MKYLLDTHIFIWAMCAEEMLSTKERAILTNLDYPVYVSVASFWEISIKLGQGKIRFAKSLEWMRHESPFELLPIDVEHAIVAGQLPFIHRDPFDRMLIAQAQHKNLTMITRDDYIKQYDVAVLEANITQTND